jgi:thiol:disulfide interchange protein DsbC
MKHTMRKSFLLSLVLAFLGNYAMADAIPSKIKARLDVVVPGYDASSVKPSPVPGLYEFVGSGRVLYISEDGRYIVNGNVIDMEGQKNLTELSQRKVTIKLINGYDEKKMITFSPEGKPKHIITVFTDVDCPYCSMLHKEVPKLNDAGIEVRYLMYPRAGEGSPTYHKSVSAWCNDDQQKAISIAKEGGVVAPKTCDNPVKEQFELGKLIGVTGTPTLILENGKILPGFVPAAQLIKIIDDQA